MKLLKYFILCGMMLILCIQARAQKDSIYFQGDFTQMILLPNASLYVPGSFISNLTNGNCNIHNAGEIVTKGSVTNNTNRLFYSSSNAIQGQGINTTGSISQSLVLSPIGKFSFCGKDTQKIMGMADILFNNVFMNGNNVHMKSNTRVYGALQMESGNWELAGKHVLFFDTTSIDGYQNKGYLVGESAESHVTGNSGYLHTYRLMSSKDSSLGFGISSPDNSNIGYTQVFRYHFPNTDITDTSIQKYYKVVPPSSITTANVSIEYISTDLLPETKEMELRLWRAIDMATEFPVLENSTIDTTAKKVSTIEALTFKTDTNLYTLAPQNCKNPPKIKFTNGDSIAICFRDPYEIRATIENYNFDKNRLPYRYVWNNNLKRDSTFHADSVQSGFYTLLVTDRRGCHTLDTFRVRVKLRPRFRNTVSFHPLAYETTGNCLGHGIRFRARLDSTLARNQGLLFYWWYGDSTHGTSGDSAKIMAGFGQYVTKLKVTNYEGCDTSAINTTTVFDLPHPDFSITKLNSFMREFNNQTMENLHSLAKTQWVFEDTTGYSNYYLTKILSGKQNAIIEQRDTGTYRAKLITTQQDGMCVDSIAKPFTIRLPSYLSFYPTDTVVCVGQNVKLIDNSRIDDMSLSNIVYIWNIDGDILKSTVSTSPDYTFTTDGQKTIIYTVYDSITQWTASMTKKVRVLSLPTIGFVDTITTCGKTFIIKPSCTNIAKYKWNTGASSSTYKAMADGLYRLTVTDNYGCVATDSIYVIMGTELKPRLSSEVNSCGAIILNTGYTGYSHQWFESSDLSTVLSEASTLNVTKSGEYLAKVFVDSCSGQTLVKVTIRKPVVLDLDENITLCQGEIYSLDASAGQTDSLTYSWTSESKGLLGQKAIFQIATAGRYIVTAVNPTSGCSASDSCTISFNALPVFTLGADQYLCNQGSVLLSTGVYGDGIVSQWTSDNGFSASGADLNINTGGIYIASVTNGLGCIAYDTILISVQQTSLSPDFLISSEVYTYDTVQFIQMSTPTPISYHWEFGDGGISAEANPQHQYVYPDSFKISLAVSDGYCTVAKTKTIEVRDVLLKKKTEQTIKDTRVIVIESAKVFPVPNNGEFTLDVILSAPSDMIIYLYSIRGALVDVVRVKNTDLYKHEYNLRTLSKGIYILKIMTPKDSKAFKVLIQ